MIADWRAQVQMQDPGILNLDQLGQDHLVSLSSLLIVTSNTTLHEGVLPYEP